MFIMFYRMHICDHCGLVFNRKWNQFTKRRCCTDAAVLGLQTVPISINTLNYPKCDPYFVCDSFVIYCK